MEPNKRNMPAKRPAVEPEGDGNGLPDGLHPETLAIRTQTPRTGEREHSTPLFLTSSYVYDSAEQMAGAFIDEEPSVNIYSRFSNPTVDEFIRKVCLLEGADDGIATATGMSAVFTAFMTFLSAGDHILSASAVFGSTHTILTKYLPRWGISSSYFDMNRPEEIASLIRPETKMLYLETPSNPGLDILDMALVGDLCRERGILFMVDNCFATPAVQRPMAFGADLVMHSATKFMDGQGRVLGGVVVGRKDLVKEMHAFARNTGPSMSPFNAWVLTKSLETLHVRMDRHASNALLVSKRLERHPAVAKVRYPWLESHPRFDVARKQMSNGGGIVTFELAGGLEAGKRFLNHLGWLSRTNNLGDSRTIVSHPASTTHAKLTEEERQAVGITPGLIRVSVGLEHPEDIAGQLETSLEASW